MLDRIRRWLCKRFGHRMVPMMYRCWHGHDHLSARLECQDPTCTRCGDRMSWLMYESGVDVRPSPTKYEGHLPGWWRGRR